MKQLPNFILEKLSLNRQSKTYLTLDDFAKKYHLEKNDSNRHCVEYNVDNDVIDMFEKLNNINKESLDKSIKYITSKFDLKVGWLLTYDIDDQYLKFCLEQREFRSIAGTNVLATFIVTYNDEIRYFWPDKEFTNKTFADDQKITKQDIIEIEAIIFTWIDYLLS